MYTQRYESRIEKNILWRWDSLPPTQGTGCRENNYSRIKPTEEAIAEPSLQGWCENGMQYLFISWERNSVTKRFYLAGQDQMSTCCWRTSSLLRPSSSSGLSSCAKATSDSGSGIICQLITSKRRNSFPCWLSRLKRDAFFRETCSAHFPSPSGALTQPCLLFGPKAALVIHILPPRRVCPWKQRHMINTFGK